MPKLGFVSSEKIVLRKDGTWMADGLEIGHEKTRKLFSKSIQWDEKNRQFFLKIGNEAAYIEVEDTPYFVVALEDRREGAPPQARLSNTTQIVLSAERLQYENGGLYLTLDDGQRAKFLSEPYYELLSRLQQDERGYYLLVAGKRVNLGPTHDQMSHQRIVWQI